MWYNIYVLTKEVIIMEMDDIKFYKIYKQHKEDAEKKLKRNLSQEEKNLMKKMMLEEGAKRGILTDRLKKVAVAAGIISAAAVVGVGAKTVIDTHSNKQSDAEIENANANESVNMNEKTLEGLPSLPRAGWTSANWCATSRPCSISASSCARSASATKRAL